MGHFILKPAPMLYRLGEDLETLAPLHDCTMIALAAGHTAMQTGSSSMIVISKQCKCRIGLFMVEVYGAEQNLKNEAELECVD